MIISDIKEFFSFLRPSNIKGWFNVENLFVNYFWFFTICSLYNLFFRRDTLFNIGIPVLLYLMLLKDWKLRISNIIDLLWVIEFFWIIFTWVVNDYPHKAGLIIRSFLQEIAYMMAYWIGKDGHYNFIQRIIINARKPLLIGCRVGIYCFLFQPAWYLNRIEDTLLFWYEGSVSTGTILEQMRLRSFYNGPYPISYICSIALVLEVFLLLNKSSISLHQYKYLKYLKIYMLLLVVTLILTMMRAPIMSAFVGVLLAIYYSMRYSKINIISFKFWGRGLIIGLLSFIFLSYLDADVLSYMLQKFESVADSGDSFLQERFFLQAQSFTLLGEGFARYNVFAYYHYNMPSIADGEYVKIIAEQGFIGLVLVLGMFIAGALKAFINFKDLFLELCILIMLFICMIGADPLSIFDKHCFIFWLALGQISNFKSIGYVKRIVDK